jgi:predicted metal-dependent phosphoesterase TrpH
MTLKVELHTHTSDDPADDIPHTALQLIDRAADLGYQALAITLHDRQLDLAPLCAHAARRGLVLIPGVERAIQGRHVLLLNFSPEAERVETFEDLAALKQRERGLVIAPHPFFPLSSCLGRIMDQYPDVFDAVEVNAMYMRGVNFNRRAIRWARRHAKPMVGNGDIHRLTQLGTTYSLVDAAPDAQSICDAIRLGRVEVRTEPLPWHRALAIFSDIIGLWVLHRAPRTTQRRGTSSKA